jgi:hypothetical protein
MLQTNKIYIDNYNPSILANKLNLLKDLLVDTKLIKEIYSTDGLYRLENNVLYQLEPAFKTNIEVKKFTNITFIIDSTPVTKVEVQSQLPIGYLIVPTSISAYKKSGLTLYVESIESNIVGFYFEYNGKIDFTNQFFKEDLSMFLNVLL